ncbi:MAG: DUF1284 domain-containing protein [Thermodesulfovibrionales bacterium]
MIILRGHHLICLNFFRGEGYDEAFIDNLRHILNRVKEEEITVTLDADDVCTACLWLKEDRCEFDENSCQEMREMDAKAMELLGLSSGDNVRWNTIREKLRSIFTDWFSLYCRECDWKAACEKDRQFEALKDAV